MSNPLDGNNLMELDRDEFVARFGDGFSVTVDVGSPKVLHWMTTECSSPFWIDYGRNVVTCAEESDAVAVAALVSG